MSIKTVFDNTAESYDSTRRQLIPCFDDFYGTARDIIPFPRTSCIKVLDLGAGTGLFSYLVSQYYPYAEFTLYDLSQKMLDTAKKRFSDSNVKVEYVMGNYSSDQIDGTFDLIISALSIHHLSGAEKEAFFHKLHSCLNDNALFINADQVLGETPFIESMYRSVWLKQVMESGLDETSLSSAIERMTEDRMSTLSDQLKWLRQADFSEVNCWYQNYSFVVYSGWKNPVNNIIPE